MAVQGSAVGVLDQVGVVLDGFDAASVSAGELLGCAGRARGLASRLLALAGVLLGRADAERVSMRSCGTPTSSWLAAQGGLSKREAAGALHQARELGEHPQVRAAAVAGRISMGQARAITRVLDGLTDLDAAQRVHAEQVMVDMADGSDTGRPGPGGSGSGGLGSGGLGCGGLDSGGLARSVSRVLAVVVPDRANEVLERRLQRQAETAHQGRAFTFARQAGSVTFNGSLPRLEGESWIALLQAYVESQRRTLLEERDPLAVGISPVQRWADALMGMVRDHQAGRQAPTTGGDRPRVVVTLNYHQLVQDAAAAGLIGDGQPISAGELRRLCCDADLLPVVLGGDSEVLDVGRQSRLVTPPIRAALTLRDAGCVFPGCHTPPAACEAHHIQPWWAGGVTSLNNLVLLCHHHHALIEPTRYGLRDQWQIHIGKDGIPQAIPPKRYDPERKPIRHQRFNTHRTGAAPCTPPGTARSGTPRPPRPDETGRSSGLAPPAA